MANGIANDNCKRAVFLSVIGQKPYQLLNRHLSAKLSEMSCDNLVKTMCKHHDPPLSEIV